MLVKLAFLLLGSSLAFVAVFGILAAIVLLFEIWMLVDVIRNAGISSERKILWVIGMLLIHPIVAIVYYFTDHRARY